MRFQPCHGWQWLSDEVSLSFLSTQSAYPILAYARINMAPA